MAVSNTAALWELCCRRCLPLKCPIQFVGTAALQLCQQLRNDAIERRRVY